MKTLDEVIKAFECCELGSVNSLCEACPYVGIGSCNAEIETDALHYLKALKDILDPLKVKKISHEITCPKCNSVIAILLPESNDPLTWEQLKTMEGKPVWVDPLSTKALHTPGWGLVGKTSFTTWEGVECCSIVKVGVTYALPVGEYGKTWKAYRKERG